MHDVFILFSVDHPLHMNEPGITNTEEHDYTPSFMDTPATPPVECGNVDGYYHVPMFIDPHYLPQNVRKREKRKEDRVKTLKKSNFNFKARG